MQTDDQLADDLRAGFRATTDGLTYEGRVPTLRRSPLVLAPVALTGAAAVAIVAIPTLASDHGAKSTKPSVAIRKPTPTTTPTLVPTAAQISKDLATAGITINGPTAASAHLVARVVDVDSIPADAKPTETKGDGHAFLGVDPVSGENTAWVRLDNGKCYTLSAPDVTLQQLAEILGSDEPRAVPLVS